MIISYFLEYKTPPKSCLINLTPPISISIATNHKIEMMLVLGAWSSQHQHATLPRLGEGRRGSSLAVAARVLVLILIANTNTNSNTTCLKGKLVLVATSSLTSHASLACRRRQKAMMYMYICICRCRCRCRCRVSGVYFSIPKAKAWRVKVKQEG